MDRASTASLRGKGSVGQTRVAGLPGFIPKVIQARGKGNKGWADSATTSAPVESFEDQGPVRIDPMALSDGAKHHQSQDSSIEPFELGSLGQKGTCLLINRFDCGGPGALPAVGQLLPSAHQWFPGGPPEKQRHRRRQRL